MITAKQKLVMRARRHYRVRRRVIGTVERPRLAVFRSNRFIFAQLIDDASGRTLAAVTDRPTKKSASKVEKSKKGDFAKVNRAKLAGETLAKAALAKNIKQVVFDRGGYLYAGRVKALAEGARAGGLIF